MRYVIAFVLILLAQMGWATDWEDHRIFNRDGDGDAAPLRVISSTDTDLFSPLITAFILANPDVSIEYLVTGTADIDHRVQAAPDRFDIVISSAMDLQLKLTNDGFALALSDIAHPSWAQWRDSLFAFTAEPAAIVINRSAFTGRPIPQSRQELIEALRARPDVFRGRIGTYDVRSSGLGYLFATQDARASESFWRLMEVMGGLDARLYCCSGDMIDDLLEGEIDVAYNVLGSYAEARAHSQDVFEIVHPADFPTTMMRTAFVSRASAQPEAARAFIQFILSYQSTLDGAPRALPPLLDAEDTKGATIALEPALMVFLDALKRNRFLSEWENALIQN